MGRIKSGSSKNVVGEKIVYVESPELKKKCDGLEKEIQALRSAPSKVVEKIVEKVVGDIQLKEKYEAAKQQIEALEKARIAQLASVKKPEKTKVEIQYVDRPVPVEKIIVNTVDKKIHDIKYYLMAGAVGSVIGLLIGRLL